MLRGQVSSYYQKQMAQEVVRHLPGVEVIVNGVDVVSPSQSDRRLRKVTDGCDALPVGWQLVPPK